jgi:hypothetical protein
VHYDVDKVVYLARLTETEGFIPLGKPADHDVDGSLAYAFELLANGARTVEALEELRFLQELEATALRTRQLFDSVALQMIAEGEHAGYIRRRFAELTRALGDPHQEPGGRDAALPRRPEVDLPGIWSVPGTPWQTSPSTPTRTSPLRAASTSIGYPVIRAWLDRVAARPDTPDDRLVSLLRGRAARRYPRQSRRVVTREARSAPHVAGWAESQPATPAADRGFLVRLIPRLVVDRRRRLSRS